MDFVVLLNEVEAVQKFVNINTSFDGVIFEVRRERWNIDGKSLMGMFSLNLSKPVTVHVDSEYDDKYEAILSAYEDAGFKVDVQNQ